MNILLVEPHPLLGNTYKQALEQAGHTVVWQKKAQKAIHSADERTPDGVVLELQLPKHNGIAFLYEFRSYPDWQSIPVVVHSLVPIESLKAQLKVLKELGIHAYLYKPQTTLKMLCSTLDAILQPTA